uniref:Uncharacterized protein n=1 Tax=Cacopsylla melanoneura TaxID=428564 RepID=A0A8D9BBL7_9HEMI
MRSTQNKGTGKQKTNGKERRKEKTTPREVRLHMVQKAIIRKNKKKTCRRERMREKERKEEKEMSNIRLGKERRMTNGGRKNEERKRERYWGRRSRTEGG